MKIGLKFEDIRKMPKKIFSKIIKSNLSYEAFNYLQQIRNGGIFDAT